jgi:hypothetical protein
MNVENIDMYALVGLVKQTVFSLKQRIYNELMSGDEFKDDIKPAVKEMLTNLTYYNICSQVTLILGINTNSKREYSDMREELDAKVSDFTSGKISMDDLIRFIQNLYIKLLNMESEALDKRVKAVREKKAIMIGRQCIGH